MIDNKKDYTNLYDTYANDLVLYKTNKGLSAAVYTEITDVEVELNGLLTYDREIDKGGAENISASNKKVINDQMYISDILPSSQTKSRDWKYTFARPEDSWFNAQYNDAAWKSGPGGFGTSFTPGVSVKTVWDSSDIWVRQEFTLNETKAINKDDLVLYIHHDETCEVYINGVKAATIEGATSGYTVAQMTKEGKAALNLNGKNVIAIHCHQTVGGQYIDAGISLLSKTKP
jgi:hypothetical protein